MICRHCGRDINKIGQDNMSTTNLPLCEDCFYSEDYENNYYDGEEEEGGEE